MNSEVEIELKIKLLDQAHRDNLEKTLNSLRAEFISDSEQHDTLFLSEFIDFKHNDQALRLRVETVQGKDSTTILAFKGTPTHTSHGHKIREEFETIVEERAIRKILEAVGCREAYTIKKKRKVYKLGNIVVAFDELKFGNFLELEGPSVDIEQLRNTLGLQDFEPVTQGYIFLQWEFEAN